MPVLYPIIDTDVCRARGVDPLVLAEACFRGGARWLQIRDKGSPGSGAFLALADDVARLAARFVGAKVIVNDRADICRMANCAGVHVGQEDLSVEDARRLVGPDAIVGLSTHDRAQIDAALSTTATYIAVGPIYPTATKDTGYGARGLDLIGYAANRGKPVVAIGGITLARAAEVLRAGASAVAVITDVLTGGDPEARARAFVDVKV
jgi:thiamine-phosphate pyrophosphorylase